jgi:hypothetical protein
MSNHGAPPANDGQGHQSEDHIDFGKVIAVGAVSLIIFALGTWWAAAILHHETKRAVDATGLARQPVLGQSEIGIVDQVPFAGDRRLDRWREARAAHLNSYGWIDRGKGIVHVPIERAMEAAASGALPDGAPR